MRKLGLEGVVGNRVDSGYESGERSGAWIKLRTNLDQEFVQWRLHSPVRMGSMPMRKRFRCRAAIEPVISHLKHGFRLLRCFFKGFQGRSTQSDAGRCRTELPQMDAAVPPFLASPPMLAQNFYLPLQRII